LREIIGIGGGSRCLGARSNSPAPSWDAPCQTEDRSGILDPVHEHLAALRTTADAGRTLPSYGPAWDAAIEFGIDVTLLEHNLALSPSERLLQLDEMLRLYFSIAR
jgi:hypothetical protein